MNAINFNQTGGFPLSTDILNEMQLSYQFLNTMSTSIGDNCIVSGCVVSGNYVGDGVVIINGELLPFKGSLLLTNGNVSIREEVETRVFEDLSEKAVLHKRYAILTTDHGVSFSEMPRVSSLEKQMRSLVPKGMISMWSGSADNLPLGWVVCNGENDTPDLRDRFIVGAGQKYTVGDTGGLAEVTLTEQQMPKHTHSGKAATAGAHSHRVSVVEWKAGGQIFRSGGDAYRVNQDTSSAGAHEHTLNINSSGGNESHENRPPYYALVFIMYKG